VTNDPRPLFERAADQFAVLVKSVEPGRFGDPTPCTEFDVRALISHVVAAIRRIALVGEGGDAVSAPIEVPDVADDGLGEVYEEARSRFRAAWADDAALARTVTLPWGVMSGAEAVGGYVMEMVTHTWDLSRALGHPVPLDLPLAELVLPMSMAMLPAEPRGGEVPFGPVREAPAGADAYERLAAWMGREV
jgi:uncharacterized protein (TIGR03086 family)